MSFDSGPLDRYLSAAFGDDPAMAMDLRGAFTGSARDLADLMRRARCDANWEVAALRLKGLAANFGIIPLIAPAAAARGGGPGEPAGLRQMNRQIDDLALCGLAGRRHPRKNEGEGKGGDGR